MTEEEEDLWEAWIAARESAPVPEEEIPWEDIRVDRFRTGIPYNKDCSVRLTHILTGTVVVSAGEDSEFHNTRAALAELKRLLREQGWWRSC